MEIETLASRQKARKSNRLRPNIRRRLPPVNSLLDVVLDGMEHSLGQAKRSEARAGQGPGIPEGHRCRPFARRMADGHGRRYSPSGLTESILATMYTRRTWVLR